MKHIQIDVLNQKRPNIMTSMCWLNDVELTWNSDRNWKSIEICLEINLKWNLREYDVNMTMQKKID